MRQKTTGAPPLRVSETRSIIEAQILGLIVREGRGTFRETEKLVGLRALLQRQAQGGPLSDKEQTLIGEWTQGAPNGMT